LITSSSNFRNEALEDITSILSELMNRDRKEFIAFWNSVGTWLLDKKREEFLIKTLDILDGKGIKFLELANWLLEHSSGIGRLKSLKKLANFYMRIGATESAAPYIKELKHINGYTDDTLRLEAQLLYTRGDNRAAVLRLLLLKQMLPEDRRLFSIVTASIEDKEELINFYKRAIDKYGGNTDFYNELANILYQIGRLDEAIQYYNLALRDDPNNEWALLRISMISGKVDYVKRMKTKNPTFKKLPSLLIKESEVREDLTNLLN
ncbi:MAG: tetratricopeptide repeat protein, partial [Nitrospirae bacterium]